MKLSIAHKLLGVTGVILLLAGGTVLNTTIGIQEADRVINGVIGKQTALLDELRDSNTARQHFDEMRYWLSDLSASWEADSEDKADEAHQSLNDLLSKMRENEAELVDSISPKIEAFRTAMLDSADYYLDEDRGGGNAKVAEGRALAVEVANEIGAVVDRLKNEVAQSTGALVSNNSALLSEAQIGLAITVLVGTILALFFARAISGPLKRAVRIANRIADGDLDNEVVSSSSDETGQLMNALATMQTALVEEQARLKAQMEEERVLAERNARVRQGLDTVAGSVMLADADHSVVYTNAALRAMFETDSADIRKVVSNFDPADVIGGSLDVFGTEPALRAEALDELENSSRRELRIGELVFSVVINPVRDAEGRRIGTVVEWNDRSVEIRAEEDVQRVVSSACEGDLNQRIDLANKQGFTRTLGASLNELLQAFQDVTTDTVTVIGALSSGNLEKTIEGDYQGVFGQLKDDTNNTVQKLREVIRGISDAADTVGTGSDQLAQGNIELSRRTEEQAQELRQTSASMQQLAKTVEENTENARQASALAGTAQQVASAGGVAAVDAVTAMEAINAASIKIANIIGVIDEIAFQTNLLALNASVEAARAGEQGRGFSVVASEVRSLAERCASAAGEIGALIRDSNQKVEEGCALVGKSGKTLEEIVTSVKKVNDIVAEIVSVSEVQAKGLSEVASTIGRMDEMTQQNAAMVEEVAASSSAMADQSASMTQQVAFFAVPGNRMVSDSTHRLAS